ncbi:MAG: hypothetical protein KF709_11320 [Gemmatimonadaceae bacterium]|nr:hypothetical protein [Gemmatimonadaceae bacterium]
MASPLSPDTTQAAAALQYAAWRAMTPAQKLEQVAASTSAVLDLERAGLRRQHPEYGAADVHWASVLRRLGHELAARVAADSAA